MLSKAFKHKEIEGNLYFIDFNSVYGEYVRQIQYKGGLMIDTSDSNFAGVASLDKNVTSKNIKCWGLLFELK